MSFLASISHILILIIVLVLWGCTGSRFRSSDCAKIREGTYSLLRMDDQSSSTVTVHGTIADVERKTRIEADANLTARPVSNPDSVITGANVSIGGKVTFELEPETVIFQAAALGYNYVRTDPVVLPPGSVWEVVVCMEKADPFIEPDF